MISQFSEHAEAEQMITIFFTFNTFLFVCDQSFLDSFTQSTLKVLVTRTDALEHFKQNNCSTVGGDGGCRVGEVRAGTTSPMPDQKGFKLQ